MQLKDICEIRTGYTPRGRLDPDGIAGTLVIQLGDLGSQGAIDIGALVRYRISSAIDRYLVFVGDVLFRSRGDRNTAVMVDKVPSEPVIAVLPVMILRPNRKVLDPRFLAWIINQKRAQQHFDASARGTSLRMVAKPILEDLDIDVPDLATQRAIVTVDDLAAREHALMTRLAEKKLEQARTLLTRLSRDSSNPHRSTRK